MGKITRSETRRKKEQTVTKKSIIFPAKHNPREQSIKAVIKKYEHILHKKEILTELFSQNSFVVANKRARNLHQLMVRYDPYNIVMDLSNQKRHCYSERGRKCDSCDYFVLEKTSLKCQTAEAKFKVCRDSACTTKCTIYLVYCKQCSKQGAGPCIE